MDAVEKTVKVEKFWREGLKPFVPLVITIAAVLAAVFGFNKFVNSKIDPVKDLLNAKIEMLKENQAEIKAQMKDNQTEMKKRMDSIETKLDHVITKAGFSLPGKKSVSR